MMRAGRTYLDHNASSPLRPEARAAMLSALERPGNASSVHAEGRAARALVEAARGHVAALVGALPSEVCFTSGGTEASNWALSGDWSHMLLASGIEHDAVVAPARASGAQLIEAPVSADGRVTAAALEEAISRCGTGHRGLVSLQFANNETGVLQPLAELAAIARARGLMVHTDAVQAAGRVRLDFAALDVDLLSVSAHKLGGPKGIGALIIRDGIQLPALIHGGGQEMRRRAGTENVAAIAGFGAAAEAARQELPRMAAIGALRDRLEREALAITPSAVVIGSQTERLANTTCLALPGAHAETLVIALDLAGTAVSAGAACSSGKVSQSRVLTAMGVADELARAAIRISLGWNTVAADVDAFLAAWAKLSAAAIGRRRNAA